MNKEQLNAIKERANKATEGPWKIFEDSEVKAGCQIGTAWDHPQAKGPVGIVNLATSVTGGEIKNCVYIQSDDARFIAHARQDVPALIAEVERLREFEVFVKMYYTQFLKERSENESRRLTANTQLGFYVKVNDLLGEPNGLPLKEGESDE